MAGSLRAVIAADQMLSRMFEYIKLGPDDGCISVSSANIDNIVVFASVGEVDRVAGYLSEPELDGWLRGLLDRITWATAQRVCIEAHPADSKQKIRLASMLAMTGDYSGSIDAYREAWLTAQRDGQTAKLLLGVSLYISNDERFTRLAHEFRRPLVHNLSASGTVLDWMRLNDLLNESQLTVEWAATVDPAVLARLARESRHLSWMLAERLADNGQWVQAGGLIDDPLARIEYLASPRGRSLDLNDTHLFRDDVYKLVRMLVLANRRETSAVISRAVQIDGSREMLDVCQRAGL